jgi:hypothetical protein
MRVIQARSGESRPPVEHIAEPSIRPCRSRRLREQAGNHTIAQASVQRASQLHLLGGDDLHGLLLRRRAQQRNGPGGIACLVKL